MTQLEQVKKAVAFLRKKTKNFQPEIALITGSGLAESVPPLSNKMVIPYITIPGFLRSTVPGHTGNLIFGTYKKHNIVVMQGRFHYYEGYDMKQVTLPIRVMKQMGVQHLILSNAAGGMNPDYNVGDLVLITDHLNMFMTNPLIGKNDDRLGPRFPDMGEVYSKALINLAA